MIAGLVDPVESAILGVFIAAVGAAVLSAAVLALRGRRGRRASAPTGRSLDHR